MKFELIKGTKNLQGTCYFEFVKNSDKKKTCWNENAYYLEDELFGFYYPTFKKASERFDWYEFNKLNQSEIGRLIKELSSLEKEIKIIKDEEAFKDFFDKIYFWIENYGNPQNWNEYAEIFSANAVKLRELAAECLEEKQTLWVLGM